MSPSQFQPGRDPQRARDAKRQALQKSSFGPSLAKTVGIWRASLMSGVCAAGFFSALRPLHAVDEYWRTDGISATWTSSSWSLTGTAPFATGWTANNNAIFNANSPVTFVTNTQVGNVTVASGVNVTLSPVGTYSTNGVVRTLDVGAGGVLDYSNQGFSTVAGTGFIKNGSGIFFSSNGNAYTGGFTLNAGTVIIGGVNALGNGGALAINGGTIAANNTRNITSRYTSVTIGGDFTIGAITTGVASGNATSTANITFADSMSLGATTRAITIGANGTYTLGGALSGTGTAGLTVSALSGATGVLVLGGANTYAGPTTISSGTLRVNGSLATTSAVSLTGGTLAGNGTVGAITVNNSGSAIAPGIAGIGVLTAASAVITSGSFAPALTNSTTFGQLSTGALTLTGAALALTLTNPSIAVNDTFRIVNNTGIAAIVGNFTGLPEGSTFNAGGVIFAISYVGGDGNDIVLTSQTAIPEPTTWAAAALLVVAVVWQQRRRIQGLLRA